MKVAILADTHCGVGNDSLALNEYFLQFFETIFFPYLKFHNIKTVIHLGDTFDRRKYINFNTLFSWQKSVFSPLHDWCDRVDFLIGNHDTYYKNTNSVNSVNQLLESGYSKFKIFQNCSEVEIDGAKILYVPWICDDNAESTIAAINTTHAKICMGHLHLKGFELHPGHISLDGLNPAVFDRFYITMSGHFHQKNSSENIHYLGAPYPMNWGDYGMPRGFHIFDTNTLDLTFIQNPLQIYVKLYYDDSDASSDSILSECNQNLFRKFVKVIVKKKTNPYWFDQYFDAIQKQNPADISIIESSNENITSSDVEVDEAKDTLTILHECANMTVDGDLQKLELNSLLRELYLEALNSGNSLQLDG